MNYPKNRYKGIGPWRNKDWLYREYVVKNKSSKRIAEENSCKQSTIQQWLRTFDIKKDIKVKDIEHKKIYQTKEYLYQKHIIEHITISQIAKENNVDFDTIKYFCKKYNIKTWRSYIPNNPDWNLIIYLYQSGLSAYKLEQIYGINHKTIIRNLKRFGVQTRTRSEAQFNYNGVQPSELLFDKDWLEFQHFSLNRSCKELGEQLGVDAGTVRRHMKSLGIKPKNNAESKIGILSGENHPNWKGGITKLNLLLREFFNVNLAPLAAKRDGYKCRKCGATHTILHVHHKRLFSEIVQEIIDEHKDLILSNTEDKLLLYQIITKDKRFLDIDNLITLCKDCHKEIHKTISNQAS